jgi:hypothetical protein
LEAIYYTLAAIALYFTSDWVLQRIEHFYGRRFEHRSIVFFAIILSLALITFSIIRRLAGAAG